MNVISNYLVQLGDSSNILSHRLAEMYASGPTLEECIALTNISLDHLGQATSFYENAAKLDNDGKTAEDIAYRRNERQYFNYQLVEQPNVNFAHVMLRQFFVDSLNIHYYEALCNSSDEMIAAIAAKAIKEVRYHRQHSSQWLLRLGKGTKVSHDKLKDAMIHLWPYTNEYFISDEDEKRMQSIKKVFNFIKVKFRNDRDLLNLSRQKKNQNHGKLVEDFDSLISSDSKRYYQITKEMRGNLNY